MPASAGKKRQTKQAETQANKTSGFMTHAEYKQKLFREQPEVKAAYNALEPDYQREVAALKKTIGKRSKVKP